MAAIRWRQALNQWWPGLLVGVLGLVLTAVLVRQQVHAVRTVEQVRFTEEVRSSTDAIAQRMVAYAEIVAALRDLFLVDPDLTRMQFERIAAEHDVLQNYPDIVNLSFVRDRGGRYIVEYLWPARGNEGVLGLDIGTQPANLAALLGARTTRQPIVSAPFDLLQERRDAAGFLLRFPVFQATDGAPDAVPRFIGAVAVVIRVGRMLDAVRAAGFLRGLSLRLTDAGARMQTASDVPSAAMAGMALLGQSVPASAQAVSDPLRVTRMLDVPGRRWLLEFTQVVPLLSTGERLLPWWTAGAGVALSLLLAGLITLLLSLHRRAVSEAASTHQALEHSEERFRAVFNQAAVGVALSEASTGRLVRVNRKYCEILGYPEHELLQRDLMSLTHPDDLADDLARMACVQSGEIPEFQLEKRMRRRDGRFVWVGITVSPIRHPGAAPDHHVSVIQDITERRRMQDALRDSELRLRDLLDHLPVGVCLVEQGQRITFRNQRFLQISGYTERDMPDVRSWWALTIPDSVRRRQIRQRWDQQWRLAQEGGEHRAVLEVGIRCRDGQLRIVELSGLRLGTDYLVTVDDLTARKAAEDEIRYLAYNDPLTGLPNRRLLLDRVWQALAASARRQRYGALLMLDLDYFKKLNETRGHEIGDQLLRQVAERLRDCLDGSRTIARYGDDEFVLVLEDLSDRPEEAATLAEETGQRILDALRAPYPLGEESHHSSVSMGVSLFRGFEAGVGEQLKRADLAMYQAKAAGRNTLRFFDPDMQAAVHARALLELGIREGLEKNQFELFYQPQVDQGRIMGCEALLRWKHPRDGYVSPASFIPLAEETGLILPLGDWVLQAACRQLDLWAEDPAMARLRLAVNVSPRQFHQPGFVDQVLASLAGTGADARRLELELTEGMLLQDVEDTIQKMVRLKAYGVGFSLDDFGTGYSSLAYLKRLPLDQLKIDQGFVRDVLTDPNDAAIARTIVALGISLGLRVMAEGVETDAQRAFLERHHCHAWQGYLLSPPLPVTEFEALVRKQAGAWP